MTTSSLSKYRLLLLLGVFLLGSFSSFPSVTNVAHAQWCSSNCSYCQYNEDSGSCTDNCSCPDQPPYDPGPAPDPAPAPVPPSDPAPSGGDPSGGNGGCNIGQFFGYGDGGNASQAAYNMNEDCGGSISCFAFDSEEGSAVECDPVVPSCVSYAGQSCTSAGNACGQTQANGTYACDGSCTSTPPSNNLNGQSCAASSACGTNYGTYDCNNSCSASAPGVPGNYNQSCTSAPNACGQTSSGNILCDGSCSATTPANSYACGSSCTSAGNACGQTNSGTIQPDGSCSATTPSNSGCNQPPNAPTLWGLYDNSTATYYGASAPDYHPAGYAEYAVATDPNGDNVDYLFYFYNNQTGQYITEAWSGWVPSGSYNYVNSLVNLPAGTYQVGAYAMDPSGAYSPFSGWATVTLYDVGCTSSPNSCSQTNPGTIQPDGSCSAVTPANPAGLDQACSSAANACGQTNTGTILCDSSCSAGVPSNSGCPPTATLSAAPPEILLGNSSTLTWSSTNATSCTAAGGFDTGGATNNASGVAVSPPVTSNYQISCTGPHGTGNSNIATVTVDQPSADIIVTPSLVTSGGSTNVSWSATNVTSCTVTGTDGYSSGPIAGPTIATTTISRTVTTQTKYTISCPGQSVTSSILVNIVPGFQEF